VDGVKEGDGPHQEAFLIGVVDWSYRTIGLRYLQTNYSKLGIMRSEPRLLELSSDHHEVLVVIEQIRLRLVTGDSGEEVGRFVGQKYDSYLSPHFKIEEEFLLPELASSSTAELVRRTLAEHELLRSLMKDARLGQWDALRALADVLEAHIRFEEREVYPAIEAKASNEALDHVARLETVRGG
jgi:hypothetical protein